MVRTTHQDQEAIQALPELLNNEAYQKAMRDAKKKLAVMEKAFRDDVAKKKLAAAEKGESE